ncbi:intracellular protease pfpi family [Plakobranchus ocellatus]|uniref:Intracellular protease pfpi family n=1 Tax=Plakobranchus ocellatus TaxID=259542 RepID=A0AAV4B4J3_9GAST|nr:intracellular protease pfpi family [Plakobranchus ocellatus]
MANKVGILIEYDFEDAELVYPYYRMQEAGFTPVLIGPKAGVQYKGKHGYPMTSNTSSSDVNARDLLALIIPGGWAPDRMRRDQKLVMLVKEMDAEGKSFLSVQHIATSRLLSSLWMLYCGAIFT